MLTGLRPSDELLGRVRAFADDERPVKAGPRPAPPREVALIVYFVALAHADSERDYALRIVSKSFGGERGGGDS
jgi:hypothetical protein